MNLELSARERRRMAQVNGQKACDEILYLFENPDALAELPDGAHVFSLTGDAWVDEQNRLMAEQLKADGEPVVYLPQPIPAHS